MRIPQVFAIQSIHIVATRWFVWRLFSRCGHLLRELSFLLGLMVLARVTAFATREHLLHVLQLRVHDIHVFISVFQSLLQGCGSLFPLVA